MKIKISIPDNNLQEREYSVRALMNLILDENKIEYEFETVSGSDCTCILGNDREICFKDALWNKYHKDLSYLFLDNLPKPTYGSNNFTPETDIPIIYGYNSISVNKNKIECGIDVIASTFLMLTRWEEYVNPTRDLHNRFPGSESIAVKYGFIERPVVNEYAEMIKNMLLALGLPETVFKERKFELIPTHDIDKMRYMSLKSLIGDIVKRRNPRLFYKNLILAFSNPFDTYYFLMSQSEKHRMQSHFYFMASHVKNGHDYDFYINRDKFKKLVDEIYRRGHAIGFHPGYTTSTDSKEWLKQKKALSDRTPFPIGEGRQHFLMMSIPTTLQIWADAGMKIDSTLGYADHIGFRCGTGDAFPVFNFLTREQLSLIERPLIVMDGTLKQYMSLSVEEARNRVFNLIDISKKYRMPMTILFHNSSFCGKWEGYSDLYESVLCYSFSQ